MNTQSGAQPELNRLNRPAKAGGNRRLGAALTQFAGLVLATGCTTPTSGSETLPLECPKFIQACGIHAIAVFPDPTPRVQICLCEPGTYHFRITATPTQPGNHPQELLDRTFTVIEGARQVVTLCPEGSGRGRLNYCLHCDFVSPAGALSQCTQLYAAYW